MGRSLRLILAALLAFASPLGAWAQSASQEAESKSIALGASPALEQLKSLEAGTAAGLPFVLPLGPRVFQIPGVGPEEPQEDLGLPPEALERINQLASLIKEHYYKPVESDALLRGALKGMFKELDPHSQFFTPEEFQKFKEQLTGSFVGVGMSLPPKEEGGAVTIQYTFPNSPARAGGLKGGDLIIEVDGENVGPLSLEEVVQRIRGPQGTTVTLTIARKDPATKKVRTFPVTLTRQPVTTSNVYSKTINGVGYVYFNEFRAPSGPGAQDDTATVVAQHIRRLQARGMASLIIDVRSNPGGSLQVVGQLTAMFLKRGQVVVTTRNRQGISKPPIVALKDGEFKDIPLKVLINGSSASASEILAGALKDQGRATIIGSRSYGKGTAQVFVPLRQVIPGWPDESAVKLTVETWHTPSGGSIERDPKTKVGGVTPDIEVKVDKDLELDVLRATMDELNGETPAPVDDPVLKRALQ